LTDNRSRRLGWYLPKPEGTMDGKVMGKALDGECMAEFDVITKPVLDLIPILWAFEAANLSHLEIRVALEDVDDRLRNTSVGPIGGIALVHDAETLVQQRVMSFLSSVKSFLGHTETALKRLYGKPSLELQNFKDHTHRLFDAHFSYRFLDQLRNMSQHVALPISFFNINAQRPNGASDPVYEIELRLDRAHLLATWMEWKPIVKRELAEQPPQFDLLPLLDEEVSWLTELCCGVFSAHTDRIRTCLAYLSTLLRMIQPPPGAIPVLWVGESILPGVPPPGIEILPLEQTRRIAAVMGGTPPAE
jgi:hypothetical protein